MQLSDAVYQEIFNQIAFDGGEEFIKAMARCAIKHSAEHIAEMCSSEGNEEFEFSKGAVLNMAAQNVQSEFDLKQAIADAIWTIPVDIKPVMEFK